MPLKPPKGFIDESDPKVAQIGHPAPPWLVNYADLMTEIACFFIILYALSTSLNKQVQQAVENVQKMVNSKQISGGVEVDREGLKITINEEGHVSFFKSGEADTTPAMDAMIAKLVPTLKKLAVDHDIIVEGHTDNRKISNQYFDSNWELSTARATAVVRLLKNKYGLPPNHLGALGYGQYRPIASNQTPQGRAENRRVVFWVKNLSPSEQKTNSPLKSVGAKISGVRKPNSLIPVKKASSPDIKGL